MLVTDEVPEAKSNDRAAYLAQRTQIGAGNTERPQRVGSPASRGALEAADVACDPCSATQDFDHRGREPDLYLFLRQGIRHAVKVPICLDVIIQIHTRLQPRAKLIPLNRQRPEGRLIEFGE